MVNTPAIFGGAIIIAVGVASSGAVAQFAKNSLRHEQQAVCWNSSLTGGIDQLAQQIAKPELEDTLPSAMSDADKAKVLSSLSINLLNNAFTGASRGGGTINCEAAMSFSYTRPDGSIYSNNDGNIVTYIMHPAANGWSYEMSGTSIPPGIIRYKPAPQPAASTSQ